MNGKQTVFVTWFCVFLLLSCQFTNIDARKYASSSNSRKTSSSSARTSRPSTDTKYSNSHADQAKLSYSGYNSPPAQTKQVATSHQAPPPPPPPLPVAAKPASAPALPNSPDSNKPIGWNVPPHSDGNVQKQAVHNTNSAPYPQHTQQAAAPPPYSQYPSQGAPPPYSPHSNVNSRPYDAPPPYSPQGGAPQFSGAPVAGGYPHNAGGSYPQQHGYPAGGQQYPMGGQYPAGQQYPVGGYQQQNSGSGSGVKTAILAGIGGLAVGGLAATALRPNDDKTIIIQQAPEQKSGESSSTAAAAVTPVAPVGDASTAAPASGAPLAPLPVSPVAPVSGAPVDSTTMVNGSPQTSDVTAPLAPFPFPVTDINAVATSGVPPYSGSSMQYDNVLASQTPLASYPSGSNTPLAPYPSSPMCAPGQNPYDPLAKCTPLTVAPMYPTPSTVEVASNTNQNLQAQSALKSSAVSCTIVALNFIMIPILSYLMV